MGDISICELGGEIIRPTTGVKNVVKGKPVLNKFGKYMNGGNGKQFVLLINKLGTVENRHEKMPVSRGTKTPYLLTLRGGKRMEELETFLKEQAIGMCEHTFDNWILPYPKTDDGKRGVCRQCKATPLADLVSRYINENCLNEEMPDSYEDFLNAFVVGGEAGEERVFHPKRQSQQYSMRDVADSNLYSLKNSNKQTVKEFSINISGPDGYQRVKNNVFRPYARHSTDRTKFHMRFAHEDAGFLKKWYSVMRDAMVGEDLNKMLASEVRGLAPYLGDDFGVDENLDDLERNDLTRENIYDVINSWQNPVVEYPRHAGRGREEEVTRASMTLPINILDLFYLTVPLVDKEEHGKLFEKYIFGYFNQKPNPDQNKCLVNHIYMPQMEKEGTFSEIYGIEMQSALISASRTDAIEENSIKRYAESAFRFLLNNVLNLSKADQFFSSNYIHQNGKRETAFQRWFNIKKTFFTENKVTEELTNFSLFYTDQERQGEKKETNYEGSEGFKAGIGQLLLKFDKITNQNDYNKDEMRVQAYKIVKLMYDPDNRKTLAVQEKMIPVLQDIVKNSQDMELQEKVLSIFKDIINIELKNVVEIEDMNNKKEKRYAEATNTLHIAAINALREMVQEKWKIQRVDVDVLNFIKLAIEAVTVNKNMRPSTHSADALREFNGIAVRALSLARKSKKVQSFYPSKYYMKILNAATSLENALPDNDEMNRKAIQILAGEMYKYKQNSSDRIEKSFQDLKKIYEQYAQKLVLIEFDIPKTAEGIEEVKKLGAAGKKSLELDYNTGKVVLTGEYDVDTKEIIEKMVKLTNASEKIVKKFDEESDMSESEVLFLAIAMDKLLKFTEETKGTDRVLECSILDIVKKLLQQLPDQRTKVTFVLKSSARKLWGEEVDRDLRLEHVYNLDILDNVGRALLELDRTTNDAFTLLQRDYLNR